MPAYVTLHVYDLVGANQLLRLVGTGAFHAGVEVYDLEWSYGYDNEGTGIFPVKPRSLEEQGVHHREAISMGQTKLTEEEVYALIGSMASQWRGREYDLLRKNCCCFSSEFCKRLGVAAPPRWVTNLAAAGATLGDGLIGAARVTHSSIVGAARAGSVAKHFAADGPPALVRYMTSVTARSRLHKLDPSVAFKVGHIVEGFVGKRWREATIATVFADGSCLLSWADGSGRDRHRSASKIRRRPFDFSWLEDLDRDMKAVSAQEEEQASLAAVMPKFKVGDEVEGRRRGGRWRNAVVAEALADGSFMLDWEDGGGADDRCKRESEVRRRKYDFSWLAEVEEAHGIKTHRHAFGDLVQARKGKAWHNATVSRANANGSYVVAWEDGSTGDSKKTASEVRRRPFDFEWLQRLEQAMVAEGGDDSPEAGAAEAPAAGS